jgi:asparagine synthase (glutamine-hydrolysing)
MVSLSSINGCLVGRLFSSNGRSPRTELPVAEQLAIMSTSGRSLVECSSGAYVAFWRGPGDGPLHAMRDPSACLPAFVVSNGAITAVASDIECLQIAGLLRLRICAAGMAQYLAYPAVPSERTCLDGVEELRPGAVVIASTPRRTKTVWAPATFIGKAASAPAAVATAIGDVVTGLRSVYRNAGIELSGGLDSSIVASTLADRAGVPALHMVPDARDADERRYARLVAEHFRLALREVPIAGGDIDLLERPRRLTARPTNAALYRGLDRKMRAARVAVGADVMLSGAGGDSIFGSLTSTGLLVDAWRKGGWRQARETWVDLADVAAVSRINVLRHLVLRIFKDAVRRWQWPADQSLLGPSARIAVQPSSALVARLPSGSRAYVASLLRMQTILDAHDRVSEDDMQFPLMAQPVLEACLSVPTWLWISGGRDRALAREAFAGKLPREIIERRGKGRYDTLLIRSFERSRVTISETLLGGWLAQEGLIDTNAVHRAIEAPVTARSWTYERIIRLLDAELWCRLVLDRQTISRPA